MEREEPCVITRRPPAEPPAHAACEEVAIPLPGGERLPALLARPEQGEGPPVLVVSDIFGRSPFYEDMAARLAEQGYTALLPDYFFRLETCPSATWPSPTPAATGSTSTACCAS